MVELEFFELSKLTEIWTLSRSNLYRYAHYGSITNSDPSRLKDLKKGGDLVDINPIYRDQHCGWKPGEIKDIDSGHVEVRYEYNGLAYKYWTQLNNEREIAIIGKYTKSTTNDVNRDIDNEHKNYDDIFEQTKYFYNSPLKYIKGSQSAHIKLKRHLHDLNHYGAHDVAFALEACLHNYPPLFVPEDLVDDNDNKDDAMTVMGDDDYEIDGDIFYKLILQQIEKPDEDENKEYIIDDEKDTEIHGNERAWQGLMYCAKNDEWRYNRSDLCLFDDGQRSESIPSYSSSLESVSILRGLFL